MLRTTCHIGLAAALLVLAACVDTAAAADEFMPLFDGKTLEGWEGNRQMFRVEEGAIVAGNLKERIPHNEFLCTKREFIDFELRLEVRAVGENANGGIQLRSRRVPNDHEVSGYQADVGVGWWGKLYDESRRNRVLADLRDPEALARVLKPDDWNQYRIVCQGPRIQLWVNGVQTVDYTESDSAIAQRGVIAVQIHSGPPAEVWYRKVVIKPIE